METQSEKRSWVAQQANAEILEKARVKEFAEKLIIALQNVAQDRQKGSLESQKSDGYQYQTNQVEKQPGSCTSKGWKWTDSHSILDIQKKSEGSQDSHGYQKILNEADALEIPEPLRIYDMYPLERVLRSISRATQTASPGLNQSESFPDDSKHYESAEEKNYVFKIGSEQFLIKNPFFCHQSVQADSFE